VSFFRLQRVLLRDLLERKEKASCPNAEHSCDSSYKQDRAIFPVLRFPCHPHVARNVISAIGIPSRSCGLLPLWPRLLFSLLATALSPLNAHFCFVIPANSLVSLLPLPFCLKLVPCVDGLPESLGQLTALTTLNLSRCRQADGAARVAGPVGGVDDAESPLVLRVDGVARVAGPAGGADDPGSQQVSTR
jgi:hypothetical protein